MNTKSKQEVLYVENEFEHFSIPALVTESGQNVLAGVPQMALEWIQYSAKRDLGRFWNKLGILKFWNNLNILLYLVYLNNLKTGKLW